MKSKLDQKAALVLVFFWLGFSSSIYAGLASCTGSYNLGNSPTVGSGGLVSPGASSGGCEQVDKQFTAFTYTSSSVGGGVVPVPGGSVPVTFAGSADVGPISVQFGQTATWEVSAAGTSTSATGAYAITVDPTPPIQYAPPTGQHYAIDAMALGENASLTSGFPVGSSDTITLYEYFCAGGASLCSGGSASTGGINLSSATAGFLVYQLTGNGNGYSGTTSACFNNGNTNSGTDCATLTATPNTSLVNFLTSNYAQGFQSVYVYNTLTVSSGGDDTALNYFKETYFEELVTPEPATFGLMGAALAGLGLLQLRKRS